ncbi:hypothetical protein [Magnetococcus sp. PR-3]|uniref:hypothetical protein n=1 Tax=Magnetococcus sp. PR-3 TaxID=3120355 RepID=UPI002FCE0F8A
MHDQDPPMWDCRWPDPVALKVANDRIAHSLDSARPGINAALEVMVELESAARDDGLASALLVTPWAIERVYWLGPGQINPPIQSAVPLEGDHSGRVAGGQGALLETGSGTKPVIIGWEAETGHHFVETIIREVQNYLNSMDAMAAAKAVGSTAPNPKIKKSMTTHLEKPVSRRGLFNMFRS